jgi:hypothetical protein
MNRRLFTTGVILLLVLTSFPGFSISGTPIKKNFVTDVLPYQTLSSHNNNTEYWALLVGVGEYAGHPEMEAPCDLDVQHMREALLSSDQWHTDHIKTIIGKNATKINIIKGLRWLDSMEDKDDISVVYFSSHGGYLSFFGVPIDLPPLDEADRADEVLVTYYGFINPLANIRDDELNLYLNTLESHGECVIIDCCYAGGFNDTPRTDQFLINTRFFRNDGASSPSAFAEDFLKDISKEGRVVLMGTRENELGWASPDEGLLFTTALTESLRKGVGDFNDDGSISAEEAFLVARSRTELQHPTMCDWYDGELLLTTNEKYNIDFWDECESDSLWMTVDHTGGVGGDLWHLSEVDSRSPTHCWYLGDEESGRYYNNMDNSLISLAIHLGEKPLLTFPARGLHEIWDTLSLEVSTDNWSTWFREKLYLHSDWEPIDIPLYSTPFGDLSGTTIQLRLRFTSDESIPFNPYYGHGYIMIDDILIYSEKTEV